MIEGIYSYRFGGREPYRYALQVVTPPASEPVTTAEQKTHSRVDISDDDDYIDALIQAAREMLEDELGRRIVSQTWNLYLDHFPYSVMDMRCPYGPWSSIVSIQYVDLNGTTQTWSSANYALDSASFEPRIYLQWQKIYPVPRLIQNAVTIQHVSGYSTVPEKLKLAIKLRVDNWYKNRAEVSDNLKLIRMPSNYDAIIASEKQAWL